MSASTRSAILKPPSPPSRPASATASACASAARSIPAWVAGRSQLDAHVVALSDGRFIAYGPMGGGTWRNYGLSALLRVDGVEIIIITHNGQATDLAQFTSLGLDPTRKATLIVKSMQHFRAAFQPIAREVLEVDTGALSTRNFKERPYKIGAPADLPARRHLRRPVPRSRRSMIRTGEKRHERAGRYRLAQRADLVRPRGWGRSRRWRSGRGACWQPAATAEIAPLIGPGTRVIDLEGRLATPGLNDSHLHLISLGLTMDWVDSKPAAAPTLDALLGAIAARAAKSKPGDWILSRGYDQTKLDTGRHPYREELDRAAPNNPVMLVRTCGHIAICNSAGAGAGRHRRELGRAAGRPDRAAERPPHRPAGRERPRSGTGGDSRRRPRRNSSRRSSAAAAICSRWGSPAAWMPLSDRRPASPRSPPITAPSARAGCRSGPG